MAGAVPNSPAAMWRYPLQQRKAGTEQSSTEKEKPWKRTTLMMCYSWIGNHYMRQRIKLCQVTTLPCHGGLVIQVLCSGASYQAVSWCKLSGHGFESHHRHKKATIFRMCWAAPHRPNPMPRTEHGPAVCLSNIANSVSYESDRS